MKCTLFHIRIDLRFETKFFVKAYSFYVKNFCSTSIWFRFHCFFLCIRKWIRINHISTKKTTENAQHATDRLKCTTAHSFFATRLTFVRQDIAERCLTFWKHPPWNIQALPISEKCTGQIRHNLSIYIRDIRQCEIYGSRLIMLCFCRLVTRCIAYWGDAACFPSFFIP